MSMKGKDIRITTLLYCLFFVCVFILKVCPNMGDPGFLDKGFKFTKGFDLFILPDDFINFS